MRSGSEGKSEKLKPSGPEGVELKLSALAEKSNAMGDAKKTLDSAREGFKTFSRLIKDSLPEDTTIIKLGIRIPDQDIPDLFNIDDGYLKIIYPAVTVADYTAHLTFVPRAYIAELCRTMIEILSASGREKSIPYATLRMKQYVELVASRDIPLDERIQAVRDANALYDKYTYNSGQA